jgi:archaellum component FlaC
MEAMRQTWTDDRMDDLAARVDVGFERVDEQFRRVDERFEQIDEQFRRIDERFERVEEKFDVLRAENSQLFEKQWEKTEMMLNAQRDESARMFMALNKCVDLFMLALIPATLGVVAALIAS